MCIRDSPSTGGAPDPDGPAKPCDGGHFRNAWRKGQSEEEQAAYVAAGVRLLLTYPNCIDVYKRQLLTYGGKKDLDQERLIQWMETLLTAIFQSMEKKLSLLHISPPRAPAPL